MTKYEKQLIAKALAFYEEATWRNTTQQETKTLFKLIKEFEK